jgi:hypothetical protein
MRKGEKEGGFMYLRQEDRPDSVVALCWQIYTVVLRGEF